MCEEGDTDGRGPAVCPFSLMITSVNNDRVKYVRALQSRRRVRQRERCFVFEGTRLVEEAVKNGVPPSLIFYDESVESDDRSRRLLSALRDMQSPCYQVGPAVMAACTATQTPQGLLGVVPFVDIPPPELPTLSLVLDRVRDPGNLGTILRTALAAGVDQVLFAPGTVDASNPKAVRAGMGAHLRLSTRTLRWTTISDVAAGSEVWLAAADGEVPYTAVDWVKPVTLVVGGESAGAGPQARAMAQGQIRIPMVQSVDSLNTAMATAVILFEAVRQRTVNSRVAASSVE